MKIMPEVRYSLQFDPKKSARVFGRALRISTKHAIAICSVISGMNLQKAKAIIRRIIEGGESLDGKYYSNAMDAMLGLLESAEANAKAKGLDVDKLIVKASATKGFTFHRPRSRRKLAGRSGKMTNVQIVVRKA